MDESLARDRLHKGLYELAQKAPTVRGREEYVRGEQKLPFAPHGVNSEYQELQRQAPANFLGIAVRAPVQRLRVDSIKTDRGEELDKGLWKNVWQANKLDTRQSLIYTSMMTHGRGLCSVWPNKARKERPIVRPESYELVHVEMDPSDPFTPLWAVKSWTEEDAASAGSAFILPGGVTRTKTVAVVYDAKSMVRFEKGGIAGGEWKVNAVGDHPMRRVPFALFDFRPDSIGRPWSAIDMLMPQQDAINTIRFNTLLAMQFSAFRQRIVTGFDPRVLDRDGNVVYRTKEDGTPELDGNGHRIPLIASPGRVGVDRLLAFPGGDTKVFDLAESNLANYIEVYERFLTTFFSNAQIPPQYLLTQMANLSGDALTAAESTLASLVSEMQLAAGEGHEDVQEMAWYASGQTDEWEPTAETQWADAEARGFGQVVDGIGKLITNGFPQRSAFEMLPGATKQKVDRWMEQVEQQRFQSRLGMITRPFVDATEPLPQEVLDGAPAGGS